MPTPTLRLLAILTIGFFGACTTPPPANNATPAAAAPAAPAAAPTAAAPSTSTGAPDAAPASATSDSLPLPPDDPVVPAIAKWTGDLDGMIERRVIRVLTTYSKINYFVDAGTQRGLIYDYFKLFEDDLNARLKRKELRVHVVFVPVAHDELIPSLLSGKGDVVAAGTLLTEWRRAEVDTSAPTRRNVSSFIVSHAGEPPINKLEDLAGREVYLRLSDIGQQQLNEANARLKAAGKPPVTILPAPEVLADEDLLEMVSAGLAPMTLVDDYVADFWTQVYPDLVVHRGAPVRTGMETGMLVRKNSPQLLKAMNDYLARNGEGSANRNVLLQKYLKSLKYVKNATTSAEYAKLQRTVELFRKYGERYDLDFLLMAAQGYQESRLDQGAKSHVGAVGVMQVMPATGKELAVGDISQLEPNIHAGVKYVRTLMDRQFGKEPIDKLNKALFTFAAYNAGPGRLRELRARTARRGLNPNIWFNHVEAVTAEVIGRETVQYVANIYKYYLAYKLATEQQLRREQAKSGAQASASP